MNGGEAFLDTNKSQSHKDKDMRKSHWNLILAGAAGGALIASSFNVLSSVDGNLKFILSGAMAAIGVLVMYYARYY